MNRKVLMLASLGLGAILAGSVAWAAIPGAGGVINGCYEKKTGILRVIDSEAGKSCLSFETPISWNQKGTSGAEGPAGASGPAGPQGPAGPKGDEGLRWRGAWSSALSYDAGDVVSYGGASWVAEPASENGTTAGHAPPDNVNEWSLVADRGAPSAQGAVGPAGPQGPAGPPGAGEVVTRGASGPVFIGFCNQNCLQSFTNVLDLALPAGSWLVTAKAEISNAAAGVLQNNQRSGRCELSLDGGATADPIDFGLAGLTSDSASWTASHTFAASGTALLRCYVFGDPNVPDSRLVLKHIRLTALKLGSVTQQ